MLFIVHAKDKTLGDVKKYQQSLRVQASSAE